MIREINTSYFRQNMKSEFDWVCKSTNNLIVIKRPNVNVVVVSEKKLVAMKKRINSYSKKSGNK